MSLRRTPRQRSLYLTLDPVPMRSKLVAASCQPPTGTLSPPRARRRSWASPSLPATLESRSPLNQEQDQVLRIEIFSLCDGSLSLLTSTYGQVQSSLWDRAWGGTRSSLFPTLHPLPRWSECLTPAWSPVTDNCHDDGNMCWPVAIFEVSFVVHT